MDVIKIVRVTIKLQCGIGDVFCNGLVTVASLLNTYGFFDYISACQRKNQVHHFISIRIADEIAFCYTDKHNYNGNNTQLTICVWQVIQNYSDTFKKI